MFLAQLLFSMTPVFEIDRTGCYGWCPSYHITVLNDGTLTWEGRAYVKKKGKAMAMLSRRHLLAIRFALEDAGFLTLGGGYECHEVTDHETVTLTYAFEATRKVVVHYHGCKSKAGVKELSELEDLLDEIVGSTQWVGSASEHRGLNQ